MMIKKNIVSGFNSMFNATLMIMVSLAFVAVVIAAPVVLVMNYPVLMVPLCVGFAAVGGCVDSD